MDLLKVKNIQYNDIKSHVYIYDNKVGQCYMIALPDLNWSLEIDMSLNDDELKEEIVIHLFTLLDEETASRIADDLIQWIIEN